MAAIPHDPQYATESAITTIEPTIEVPASPGEDGTPVPTGEPTPIPVTEPLLEGAVDLGSHYAYFTRSGDTLAALAGRFHQDVGQIGGIAVFPDKMLLPIGTQLDIPKERTLTGIQSILLPDAEVIYSAADLDFDIQDFIQQAGGYLSTYREEVNGVQMDGAEVVQRVSTELSVSPRLLLALLELRSGWVYGQPADAMRIMYPFGFEVPNRTGLYQEIRIAATQINVGYYGWRSGSLTDIRFPNGAYIRMHPGINAGSAALQRFLAIFYRREEWDRWLDESRGFQIFYKDMFGDPWLRAERIGPIFPDGLTPPVLELPFAAGELWKFTAGPHEDWNAGTPRGALDFAPVTDEALCAVSSRWATAMAPGLVVRSANNAIAIDLDSDGIEQTGYVLVYLHLGMDGLVPPGTQVVQDEPIGHPSCQGGNATGKHVHISRKYNGEWLSADETLPLILSGWQVIPYEGNYHGALIRGDEIITPDANGQRISYIQR